VFHALKQLDTPRGLIAARTAVMTAVAAIDADMRRMTRASGACRGYDECLMRLMTTIGLMLCTFTPLKGLSEIALRYLPVEPW
jgi:hypothetical protein